MCYWISSYHTLWDIDHTSVPQFIKTSKLKCLKTASNHYFQYVEYSSTYIWTISCKKNTNYLSHVTCHSPVTCHILRKLKILAWIAVSNNQISASFLKLGQNPRMTSEKIHFSRTSCGDFVLARKMKPKFDYLTPPYFCDIGNFDKVAVTLRIFKRKFEKWHRSLTPVFRSSWWPLSGGIFEKILKHHFPFHFWTFLKIIDFTLFFVLSYPLVLKLA